MDIKVHPGEEERISTLGDAHGHEGQGYRSHMLLPVGAGQVTELGEYLLRLWQRQGPCLEGATSMGHPAVVPGDVGTVLSN
jgi:hypothetical protein